MIDIGYDGAFPANTDWMKLDPRHLSARELRAECGAGACERGHDYFQRGRAKLEECFESDDGVALFGTNRGSGSNRYHQDVRIVARSGGIGIHGQCSCPVGVNCKHVVALCLAWRDGAGHAGNEPNAFERWLAEFEGPGETAPQASPDSLLYLLVPETGLNPQVRVEFVVARRKGDGNWSKGRTARPSSVQEPFSPSRYQEGIDTEIVALLEAANHEHWSLNYNLAHSAGQVALQRMLDSGRAFWSRERVGPLRRGAVRDAEIGWHKDSDGHRLQVRPTGGGVVVPVNPPWYVDPQTAEAGELHLPEGLDADKLPQLLQAPPVTEAEAERVSRRLVLHHPGLPPPMPVSMQDVEGPPRPMLLLDLDPERAHEASASLNFVYAEARIEAAEPQANPVREVDEQLVRIHRDAAAEADAARTLSAAGLVESSAAPGRFELPPSADEDPPLRERWFDLVDTTLRELESRGWLVVQAAENAFSLSRAESIEAEVDASGSDWFSLRFDLEVDGWQVPLLPLVSQVLENYRPDALPATLYLDVGEGEYAAVPGERIEPVLQTILALYDRAGEESMQLSRLDAPRLLDLGDTRVTGAATLQKLARRLRNFDGIRRAEPPTTFKGSLREYQQIGVDWLQFLREYDLAGILADDMGLGKTIQTLAHLAIEKRAGRMKNPSLIVAPTSLMGNWRREAATFTPRLRVLVLHGPNRGEYFANLDDYDLVLTTYPLLPRDREALLEQHWHYLILDEAQQIKNPKSQGAQVVRAMSADHRLCLTGTPMENHLGELWAQFDFLLPGFLGDQSAFKRNYRTPIEKHGDSERLQALQRRVAPFVLRRTKDHVASQLPAKSEFVRTTRITGQQASLYESIRLTMEKKVRDAVAQKGLARSHITILDALLKLRQVCCDPRLLSGSPASARNAGSAKLELLMDMLPQLIDEGRRVLLFSQFTTMLGLIEQEVRKLELPYAKLTGQTKKREAAIDRFRSGAADLFLVSLKAGGTGLNLTEADTVIHYDPWWNPAVETQATDRAHRIGQDKPVFIHKLVTEGTVEEKILEMQARKQKLADSVYGQDKAQRDVPIDEETIEALLAG